MTKEKTENNEDREIMPPDEDDPQNDAAEPLQEADADIKEALAKIEVLETELATTKDRALRALADADNTRKRAIRERDESVKYAISGFARDLLDVADNFHRAIASVPEAMREENEQLKNLISGIEAVEKTMLESFEKHGIRRLDPIDGVFDPNFHEVMFEAPVPGKDSGTIIQVIEPGYILHDRLLRPARVGVARSDDASQAGESGTNVDTQA